MHKLANLNACRRHSACAAHSQDCKSPTSLLRPSAMTTRMPGLLPGSLMGATATGLTKVPSTSQPSAIFSSSCRVGGAEQVTTYSLVSPEEGC